MFGWKAHIADLKARLEKSEEERQAQARHFEQERRWLADPAHISALTAQIEDLQAQRETLTAERTHLLSCLLERNNFEPIKEASQPAQPSTTIQVLSPFGVQMPELHDAMRESVVQEETDWIMQEQGIDEMRARSEAERRFDSGSLAIKLN